MSDIFSLKDIKTQYYITIVSRMFLEFWHLTTCICIMRFFYVKTMHVNTKHFQENNIRVSDEFQEV